MPHAKRRVLQVITPSHLSGAEMQLVRMRQRMEARGHRLPVVVKACSPVADDFERLGVRVDRRWIGGKVNPLAVAELANAARAARAEIIHSHLSSASWWAGWLERMGGPPSVGHVHGFTSPAWHRRQSHLVAVSQAVKLHLVQGGIDPERITTLPNALAEDEYAPARDPLTVRGEFGATRDTPVVGAFGHLSVKKGHRELFAAMPEILRRFPTTQFWVVGRGALHDELVEQARAAGCLGSVRLTGFRTDCADLMNAIDVMALPSHREPFGLVYLEAAMLQKPVVACLAGGATESVSAGETGLLIPPRDAAALAGAVITLLEDRALAARLGVRGRERARDLFSWKRYIQTLEGVYHRVLESAGGFGATGRAAA